MKRVLFFFLLILFTVGKAQGVPDNFIEEDSKYLEDQFYLGITYNFLLAKPADAGQQNFSYGIRAGIIKDIPLNAGRNVGIGIGLGYGGYSYYTNILASETSSGIRYSIVDTDGAFKRNKIETHMLEMPIEFRWRTSTPSLYKFWRIYTGLKLSYLGGARSKYVTDDFKTSFTNKDITKFQYGITLNVGWNTFNLHAYYALNDLFKNGTMLDAEDIGMRPLRLGFTFYIL